MLLRTFVLLSQIWMVPAPASALSQKDVGAQGPKLESCRPVSERTGAEGCWILASVPVAKQFSGPVFWTLDRFATREAAQQASTPNSAVVEALGKVWLFTVGDKPKLPKNAIRVTEIGPLPVKPDVTYTAQYREAILPPGAVSRTHLHSGPEVFYTETGESCLETPAGKQVGRKGVDIFVPEGEPMELVATGTQTRRGIVLVLHASDRPHTTVVSDWKSTGLCSGRR